MNRNMMVGVWCEGRYSNSVAGEKRQVFDYSMHCSRASHWSRGNPKREIYSAANDREHAAIVFKLARQIVELEPELAAKIEIIPSTKTMLARHGSIYRAISAEVATKHGYSPSVVIYDEMGRSLRLSRDLAATAGAGAMSVLVQLSDGDRVALQGIS